MSEFQIRCDNESRKKLLQEEETVNGIDYIEVRKVTNPNVQRKVLPLIENLILIVEKQK